MTTKIKDDAVTRTAGQLRRSETEVRSIVDEYERNRSALNRERSSSSSEPKTKTKLSSKGQSVTLTKSARKESGIVDLGNGWYEVDGTKYHGRAKAYTAAGIES